MKKVIGIALVLALAASLCFGGVALADDLPDGGVFTYWDFDGEGEIEINTTDNGPAGSFDHLIVDTSGSGSSGWTSVTTYSGGSWQTISEREVYVEDGYIQTNTLRNTGTEYGARLDVSSEGSLYQCFRNGVSATYLTEMSANGSILTTYTQHPEHYFFGIYAEGNSSEWLNHDASGSGGAIFSAGANGEVGILADWENRAYFLGHTHTPELDQDFVVNVFGSGDFEAGAAYDGAWAIISGLVYGMF